MQARPRLFSFYDAPLWDSVAEDALRLQRCTSCHAFRYPPGPTCPHCLATGYAWERVSGRGRVLSWTVFHRQYLSAYPAPSAVAAVQLQEGPIMVLSCAPQDRERLVIDGEASVGYADHPDGFRLPVVRPD